MGIACALAVCGGLGTFAAFTATTTNSANSISSGTVKIDQHTGSTSLYGASNKKPGEDTTGCVRVSYSGSLAAMVRLYSSASIANGSAYNLKVEGGSGLTSPGPSMGCAGFTASSTVYDAALSSFPSSFAAGNTGKANGGVWATGDQVDYRFTVTPNDDTVANGHTAVQSTSAHDFTWEARHLGDYASSILSTPGLRSYWRLGEPSGTYASDSAGNAPGNYVNGPTLGVAGLVNNDNDTGASFGGSKSARFGDVYDFAGTQAFSLETWIKPGSGTGYRHIFGKFDHAGTAGWNLRVEQGPGLRMQLIRAASSGSYDVLSSTTTMSAGARRHVVATYDGSTMRMYVDGALEGSRTSSLAIPDTTMQVALGGAEDGTLDDMSLYNRALSGAEVAAHYGAGM